MTENPPVPKLLLVDDHEPNLLALEAVLEPLGVGLVRASSGEAALRQVEKEDFAVILMDVQMPGLDGYETMQLVRQQPRSRDVPVIFVTAVYVQPEHTHRGYALGAIDYVTKPFDAEILVAKVRALIGLYRRAQDDERRRHEERERLKDLFLAVVNHDLRNPLNTISLAVRSVVRADGLDEDCRLSLERANRAASRMTRLVNDLLDLTRGQLGGGIALSVGPTDLREVCRQVADDFALLHPHRPIHVDLRSDLRGRWDGDRVLQAVTNLVGNALQHTNTGLVTMCAHGDAERATIEVHNPGTPIPPAVMENIFEPFHRGDDSAQGLGLGLYIVREIARAHGGKVTVQSSEGAGTTFRLVLPKDARL